MRLADDSALDDGRATLRGKSSSVRLADEGANKERPPGKEQRINKPGMEVPQAPASSSSDVCGEKIGAERGKHEHRESAARNDCRPGAVADSHSSSCKIKKW